jgi:hypothetical protein
MCFVGAFYGVVIYMYWAEPSAPRGVMSRFHMDSSRGKMGS